MNRPAEEDPEPPPARNILVVDDDAAAGGCLARILEQAGHSVRLAQNGQEALDLLRTPPPPNLILLDLLMPVLSGAEFRRRQRADPALASIPVVVLSAGGRAAEGNGDLGDVGYLEKPVRPEEVFAALERFTRPARPGVLVVEDQPEIRTLLELALRHYGFPVWLAADGERAVELYRRHAPAVDVVLLDVQMPGLLDGPRTLLALQQLNPWVCCCFMSGYLGAYTESRLLEMGAFRVLQKPFSSLDELVETLIKAGAVAARLRQEGLGGKAFLAGPGGDPPGG